MSYAYDSIVGMDSILNRFWRYTFSLGLTGSFLGFRGKCLEGLKGWGRDFF